MEQVQNSYYQIQDSLSKAKEMANFASKGKNVLEACSNGMKHVDQMEKELTAMSAKSKGLMGEEAKKASGLIMECRKEVDTLKAQFQQARDNQAGPAGFTGVGASQSEMQKLDDSANVAKMLLQQGAASSQNAVNELKRQNDQTDKLIEQNKRINKNANYGLKLAELIKCTEVKHMWCQLGLIIGAILLLIIAVIVGATK